MYLFKGIKFSFLLVLAQFVLPGPGASDIIFLKDGSSVEAQKVWEEDGLVRFSLPNYEGIIITYSKEIVDRIERGQQRGEGNQTAGGEKSRAGTEGTADLSSSSDSFQSVSSGGQKPSVVSGEAVSPAKSAPAASPEDIEIDMALVDSVAGIQFYNARRPFKYQTGPDAKFHTFKDAIDDLAAKFGKEPYWIGQNLGNTNDLGQIYINLNRTVEQPEASQKLVRTRPEFYSMIHVEHINIGWLPIQSTARSKKPLDHWPANIRVHRNGS